MIASVNIDLDTLNDYANTYSIKYQKTPDPIYSIALPRLLILLNSYNIRATFFVVGRDLLIKDHLKFLKLIKKQGHEIANHTQNHFLHFEKLSFEEQKREILECHNAVKKKLDVDMKGFRAPGYNLNKHTPKTLAKNRYLYDSSIFPTILLPIFKMVMITKARGKSKSFGEGQLKNIFAKNVPYVMNKIDLLEIPISTTPIFRLPFMGTFNVLAGEKITSFNYWLIKSFSMPINYEIHPIEFLDFQKDRLPKEFARHPGISIPLAEKIKLYKFLFEKMRASYKIVTMQQLAQQFMR